MTRHPRRSLRTVVLAAALAGGLLPATSAEAKTRNCRSADLRYPFTEGGENTFGVFRLRITAGRCPRAHRVARTWMRRFEAALDDGQVKLPRHVRGFTFKTLEANAAQTYNERGRNGATTIRFDYVVPNG